MAEAIGAKARVARIDRAAVLGSGVMGATIAAHLANAGIRVLLLDIVPREGGDRNRRAATALEALAKQKPAAAYLPSDLSRIEVGNLEDETMRQKIVVRDKSCFACPIKCGKYSVVITTPFEGPTVEGPEYENIFALGSMCGIDSIEAVAAAERECDDLGMDAIETGVSIAFAMETFERGNLTAADTDGMELTFGRTDLLLPLINKIAMREGLGSQLAEGVKRAAEKIGKGSADFAMQNKGITFAGHSARGLPGFALGYATGPRGGSHHDSRPTGERTGMLPTRTAVIPHSLPPFVSRESLLRSRDLPASSP